MTDADPREFLSDPLSDVSRRERRNLLIASVVGVLVSYVGLVPTRISALGIEFPAPAQNSFLVLIALVICYFIAAFLIYSLADFFIWRKRHHDYLVARGLESRGWTLEDQYEYDELHDGLPSITWYYKWSSAVANTRIFFEFA